MTVVGEPISDRVSFRRREDFSVCWQFQYGTERKLGRTMLLDSPFPFRVSTFTEIEKKI